MLASLVPAPLVRYFARPYIAGDSIDAALDTAERERAANGVWSTLDLLGEDVRDQAEVAKNVETYGALLGRIAARFPAGPARPTVSLKPSAFTTDTPGAAFEPIGELAAEAHRLGVRLTVDMEDHRFTDATLAGATRLFERGLDVGTVLQTRLHRTEGDLAKIPSGMRVRLVIGIYPEPAAIATTDKREMKERMLRAASALLARNVYVELATHDEAYVERYVRALRPEDHARTEVQLLLGVPRDGLRAALLGGAFGAKVPLRLYVPFAIGWPNATAYLRRRMMESPSVALLVLKNLVPRG